MALFLDCFDSDKIENLSKLGVISGVTTNPKLISQEKKHFNMKQRLGKIATLINGPVAVEVTATDKKAMIAQAREFYSWNPGQIVIKIPVSLQGYEVISELERKFALPTMATCIMNFTQAYAASLAGAHYLALFWGRIEESGISPEETVALLAERLQAEKLGSRILAASIRGPHHVLNSLVSGAHIVTVSPDILVQILTHQKTNEVIAEFVEDWRCTRERGLME